MRLAVIPARGGSKRIPRKNIRPFFGQPIIAWSIAAARASGCFDEVIVSTDDEEIAEVARQHGANAPFMRPDNLADDLTGTIPVIAHAVRWFQSRGAPPTEVCCVYATAPFIEPEDLRQGLALLRDSGADYALTVTSFAFPIQRALRIDGQDRIEMFEPQHFHTRSQDLDEAWHDAGQFYWGTAEAWLAERPLFTPAAAPLRIPRFRVQDIDTPEDWQRAEALFQVLRQADR